MLDEVIYPCQIWFMTHITLMKQWDIIYIPASSSLHYYTTDEVMVQALIVSNIQGNS